MLCGKNQGNNLIFVTDLDFFVRFDTKMYDWYISTHTSDSSLCPNKLTVYTFANFSELSLKTSLRKMLQVRVR